MTKTPPAAPEFGDAIAPTSSRKALRLLARRKSPSAVTLRAPAPEGEQLADLLRLAARAPDHGKLFPWRFVVLSGAAKADFARRLRLIAERSDLAPKLLASLEKLTAPPLSVAVVSRVTEGKIPEWEQVLSVGAVCQNLLIAAEAMGYGANWITDWYAYDEEATALLGLTVGERVAGYLHIGTPAEPPRERVRPVMDEIVTVWAEE